MDYQIMISTKGEKHVWSEWVNESDPNSRSVIQAIDTIANQLSIGQSMYFETDSGYVIIPHDVLKESIIYIETKE